jgi:hypothetical protein
MSDYGPPPIYSAPPVTSYNPYLTPPLAADYSPPPSPVVTWLTSPQRDSATRATAIANGASIIAVVAAILWRLSYLSDDQLKSGSTAIYAKAILDRTALISTVAAIVVFYGLSLLWYVRCRRSFDRTNARFILAAPGEPGTQAASDFGSPGAPAHPGFERPSEGAPELHARAELQLLWTATQLKMNEYHGVAQSQAKISFRNAQIAIVSGFVVLVIAVIVAAMFQSPAVTVATGILGISGGALAAYVSRTFIRAQENTSARLQRYFTEPAEITRMLVARLLLSEVTDKGEREAATAQVARDIVGSSRERQDR